MSKSHEFLTNHVEKSRSSQRAGEFINRSKNSISLSGKSPYFLAGCDDKKKLHEIILAGEENVVRADGDAVIPSDVYTSSESVVWDGTGAVKFLTSDGILLTAEQFDFIQKHGPLPRHCYFGKSNNKEQGINKVWRDMHRKSDEARKDQSKEILYLTVGSITWSKDASLITQSADRITSPLLLCPIESNGNSKDVPRFLITSDFVKVNSILKRELKSHNIDIFFDVPDNIPLANIKAALDKIVENVSYTPNVELDINDFNICILDSTNESICQLIEKNMDALAESPLIKVLSREISYSDIKRREIAPYLVYPLLADDTQRGVMEAVRQGESVNISAAAGTGKSQTIANIVAMFAANDRNALLLSEKAAANEVVLKYLGDMGLDKYTLFLTNKMTVPELVDQIDRIRNNPTMYLDPIRSRDLIAEVSELEKFFDKYNDDVYEVIPKLDMTLYNLIGDAIVCDQADDVSMLNATVDNYRFSTRKLEEAQKNINHTISEEEFEELVKNGTTGDEETDELINDIFNDLKKSGIDVIAFVTANNVPVSDIAKTVKSNMARIIAKNHISKREIGNCGNLTLRTRYSKLTEAYAKLKALSAGFVQQQIGMRVAKAVSENYDFIDMLERIRTSRMTTLDFFKRYGKDVMKFCPIVLSTPSAAVNYITDEMNTFDALLIDEASQVPIISVLPFLIGDRQLIAFGDNMQLDITSFFHAQNDDVYDENGEYDIEATDKSILHVVQGKGIPSKRLLYHYRSKTQHLVTVSNKVCYNGNLNIVPDVYTAWDKLPENLGFELHRVDVPFDPDLAKKSAVQKNKKTRTVTEYPYLAEHEARVETKMAEDIAARVAAIREETPDKSIGIVTLNDHFQDKVIDALEELDLIDPMGSGDDLFCRSLENAQGREADIVIIAIEHDKRNIKGELVKNISGFFNGGEKTEQSGNNRLNVLFTRAREKNIIFTAFDYNEIKDTERSLKRLFTYLEYAATGNMHCTGEENGGVDATNIHAAKVIEAAMNRKSDDTDGTSAPKKNVRAKIGEGTLMVDLALINDSDSDKYDVGFILPDRPLTANALCTKINLLERAGWNVLPLSLVYLLDNSEAFANQLPKMMKISEINKLGCTESYNFLTDVKPKYPISLKEIATRGNIEQMIEEVDDTAKELPPVIRRISAEELAKLSIEAKCREVCDDAVRYAKQQYIENNFKSNYQAFLVKLSQNVQKYAELGDLAKLEFLASKVFYLYKNLREKRACYLLAELTRLREDCECPENQKFITELLEEAISLDIIKEIT